MALRVAVTGLDLVELQQFPKMLGDRIASNPIVHTIGKITGCVDPETNELRPESPCAKRKQMLNEGRYVDAIKTVFRSPALAMHKDFKK